MNEFPDFDSFNKCYKHGKNNDDNNDNYDELLSKSSFLMSKKVENKKLTLLNMEKIVDNVYDKFNFVQNNKVNIERGHKFLLNRLIECSNKVDK
jgi:hypothetical protein